MVEDGPVRRAIGRTPGSFSASEDFNNGRIIVFLQPWEERDQTTQEVVNEVNKGLATIPGVRGNATQPSSLGRGRGQRSEEHTSELQSLMRNSYAAFCLKKKTHTNAEYSPLRDPTQ